MLVRCEQKCASGVLLLDQGEDAHHNQHRIGTARLAFLQWYLLGKHSFHGVAEWSARVDCIH